MAVPLPNLDDRRWIDLVEEGRSLIPFYAPQWTDHNIHDPGITIIELLAAIAEMDIYQLNRIPSERKRKFLALIGVHPFPPRPARTVMSFSLRNSALPFLLPAQVEFEGKDLHGERTRFRTLESVTVLASQLAAVQFKEGNAFHDLTSRWRRGEEVQLLGPNPAPGTALYLGFASPLPRTLPVDLFFIFADLRASAQEAERLRLELKQSQEDCRSPRPNPCRDQEAPNSSAETTNSGRHELSHHSVHTVWEFLAPSGDWVRLESAAGEIIDETRAFTLNGRVSINVPRPMRRRKIGVNTQELFYVRCRVIRGAFDAAPVLKSLAPNAVLAEQSTALSTQLEINQGVVAEVVGTATFPTAWSQRSFVLDLDKAGKISRLTFIESEPDTPVFRVLNFAKATATATGALSLEAAFLGRSSGEPSQSLIVSRLAIVAESFRLFTLEDETWRSWTSRQDFDSSGSADLHYRLDAEKGSVLFGDGDRGRIPPLGALIFAAGYETRAELGNLQPGSIDTLSDNAHNRALLKNLAPYKKDLSAIANSLPSTGGDEAESLEEATERARQLIVKPNRAVTLGDYETLARETPGVHIARVSARANLHPGFPCYQAPGIVTVIVLPSLPVGRPVPSIALRRTISAYLTRRRVIGTRVEVAGPTYRKISVQASVQSAPGINTVALQSTLTKNINRFFDPLVGGPNGTGWPFGRDVYRSEVLQIIDETPGVENVLALELRTGDGRPQCGNICIGPTGLVDAGEHEIEVL